MTGLTAQIGLQLHLTYDLVICKDSTDCLNITQEYSQRVCRQRYEAAFSIFAFVFKK